MAGNTPAPATWFLRIAGGAVFGPVPLRNLVLWAEQGRIAPGNEVSSDRESWRPAESLAELEMTWYIEDASGALAGPFNRKAAEALIRTGRAAGEARLLPAAEADLSRLRRPGEARDARAADTAPQAAQTETPAAAPADTPAEPGERPRPRSTAAKEDGGRARQQETPARRQTARPRRETETPHQEAAPPAGTTDDGPETATAKQEAAPQTAGELRQEEAAQTARAAEHTAGIPRTRLARPETRTDEAEMLRQECDRQAERIAMLEAALREARGSYAELLTFSNARDAELLAQVRKLREEPAAARGERDAAQARGTTPGDRTAAGQNHAAPREADTPGREHQTLPAEEIEALETLLADEREFLAALREGSAKRQTLLQERLAALRRLRGGDTDGLLERQARERAREAFEELRDEHARLSRQAGERERELTGRLRLLEAETERLRSQARESESLRQKTQELAAALREREQELARERQRRSIEREENERLQQAMQERIEQQQDAAGRPPPDEGDATEENASPREHSRFRVTPWMQLKR